MLIVKHIKTTINNCFVRPKQLTWDYNFRYSKRFQRRGWFLDVDCRHNVHHSLYYCVCIIHTSHTIKGRINIIKIHGVWLSKNRKYFIWIIG